MEQIPTEVVELILASAKLNFQDVVNFGLTCVQFRDIVFNSSYIWKQKYKAQYVKLI